MNEINDFEVGDRVTYKYDYHALNNIGLKTELDGFKGTVIGFRSICVGVRFDTHIIYVLGFGHDCNELDDRDGYCYWVSPELLIKDKEEENDTVKIKWYRKGKFTTENFNVK